jgi:hypothetical protein
MAFVSEPIQPAGGAFDTVAMGRGEPGLPAAFTWRAEKVNVDRRVRSWKESARSMGELYLRRHYYELRMLDGSTWVVYFTRQAGSRATARVRWFLYTHENEEAGS